MAPSFERYIQDGWVTRDERYRAVPVILKRGVATEFDFTTVEEMAQHPYYQEFLAPFDLRWWAGVRFACEDDCWCLSLFRTPAQGPFSSDEQRRLAELSNLLSAAGALVRALGFARADAAMAAFDASGKAILLLDRYGQIIRANQAAERALGHGVQIAKKRLTSFNRDATSNFERALNSLLWRKPSVDLLPPVLLPRRDRRPLLAYLLRLDAVTIDAFSPCQAVVVLVDPDQRTVTPEEDLRALFGLTSAEARLTGALAAGASLEDCADVLEISKETARSQLKRVFSKTETQRQAELVALLARYQIYR
jgi:DNA-binding CsgD family transcriptional regulator/PAS domain-containing protein